MLLLFYFRSTCRDPNAFTQRGRHIMLARARHPHIYLRRARAGSAWVAAPLRQMILISDVFLFRCLGFLSACAVSLSSCGVIT